MSDSSGVQPLLIANTDAFQENVWLRSGCAYIKVRDIARGTGRPIDFSD